MRRAVLMFDGPQKGSIFCAGCPLFDVATESGNSCPIWGTLYMDNEGHLLREEECIAMEHVVRDPKKRDSAVRALEVEP